MCVCSFSYAPRKPRPNHASRVIRQPGVGPQWPGGWGVALSGQASPFTNIKLVYAKKMGDWHQLLISMMTYYISFGVMKRLLPYNIYVLILMQHEMQLIYSFNQLIRKRPFVALNLRWWDQRSLVVFALLLSEHAWCCVAEWIIIMINYSAGSALQCLFNHFQTLIVLSLFWSHDSSTPRYLPDTSWWGYS